jgi:hypothetical protein
MDLIIRQCYMVFINRIPGMPYNQSTGHLQSAQNLPFLELDLGRIGTRLRGDEFLQVTDSVVWATFNPN